MAKYMNQSVFDCGVLLIAKEKLEVSAPLELLPAYLKIVSMYEPIYRDDYLFGNQLLNAAHTLLRQYRTIDVDILAPILLRSFYVRKEFDDDMNENSKMKKIFSGGIFSRGHSNPELREETALINLSRVIDFGLSQST